MNRSARLLRAAAVAATAPLVAGCSSEAGSKEACDELADQIDAANTAENAAEHDRLWARSKEDGCSGGFVTMQGTLPE